MTLKYFDVAYKIQPTTCNWDRSSTGFSLQCHSKQVHMWLLRWNCICPSHLNNWDSCHRCRDALCAGPCLLLKARTWGYTLTTALRKWLAALECQAHSTLCSCAATSVQAVTYWSSSRNWKWIVCHGTNLPAGSQHRVQQGETELAVLTTDDYCTGVTTSSASSWQKQCF